MADDTLKKRIKKLLSRGEDIARVLRQCSIVDDILAGRDAVIGVTPDKKEAPKTGTIDPVLGLAGMAPQSNAQAMTGGAQSKYLFKDVREHPDEYKKRLAMTPCTVQLKGILETRMGTLNKAAVTITHPDAMKPVLASLTLKGMTFNDVRAKLTEMSQTGGFAGILLDRVPLPPDTTTGRPVSQAEAEARKLGRPIWAIYPSAQILDFREDQSGLTWVKLVEESCEQADWEAPEIYVFTVRIVDRKNITVYRVESPKEFDIGDDVPDEAVLKVATPAPHGAIDDDKQPCVPFRMAHPFPARDGIGRSVLEPVAELDIASLRVLSAIIWCLHLAGDPTLVLKTNRPSDKLPDIGLGTSHYIVLQAARANVQDAEELDFLQLDVAGIDKQLEMYDKLVALARSAAEKMSGSAMQGPREQTGISKAWTFKTGEERILFLLAECIESTLNWILRQTARYLSCDPDQVKCTYPHAYDVEGPLEVTALVEQVLPIAKGLDQREAVKQLIKKLFTALDLNFNDEMESDLDKLDDMAMQPEQLLAGAPAPGGADPNADPKQVQKQALKESETEGGAE